ncbi:MAG: hypothetical protein C4320_01165 [Armatimonadota bacterium]
MPQFIVERAERLDLFLAARMAEHSRSRLARLIQEGFVSVSGAAAKPGLLLKPGWTVWADEPEPLAPHALTPVDIPLEILYESAACLVVNKPRGLATHPAPSLHEPSLVEALLGRAEGNGGGLSRGSADFRPGIVHRLDKATTGLLVVAKTDAGHADLGRSNGAPRSAGTSPSSTASQRANDSRSMPRSPGIPTTGSGWRSSTTASRRSHMSSSCNGSSRTAPSSPSAWKPVEPTRSGFTSPQSTTR